MKEKIFTTEELINIGRIHGLSPSQCQQFADIAPDSFILDRTITRFCNKPDKEYLLSALRPDFTPHDRRDIDVKIVLDGLTTGDIIGSTREFAPYDFGNADTMPLFPYDSEPTDDTALAKATADAILKNREKPNFYKAYIKTYKSDPKVGYGWHFIDWAKKASRSLFRVKGYNSCADGSAMRVAPVGALYDDLSDVMLQAYNSAVVTHNHTEGVKGAVVVAVCIWMLIHGAEKKDIYRYVKDTYYVSDEYLPYYLFREKRFDIDSRLADLSNEPSTHSMYCPYAVPFAVKCFLESENYEQCMRQVLRHFGDNDTLCAISGALAAAYWGTTGLNNTL